MEHSAGLLVLLFVTGSLLIGAFTMIAIKGTKIPYTVALLVMGLLLGGIDRTGFFETTFPIVAESIKFISDIDPHLFLFVFLPTLIFESAYSLEVHLFKRISPQIAILAIPGLIVSTFLTAILVWYLFPWNWSWIVCLMFGALISATDPVAVVALLKEVSSRKRLETLIEGESLLNDGTAIVLFTLFYAMVISTTEATFSIFGVVGEFSFGVLLGLSIGVILGYLAIILISKVFNNPLIEISLSVGVAYLVFFVAEFVFHVSGVVSLVALALMFSSIGRTKISPEVAGFLHHFWEMMAHFANTLIFLLVGLLVITRIKLDSVEYWIALGVLYVGITIIRASSVTLFMPLLKRIGIGITKEKAIVLVWGGLRGAVSLALALVVVQNDTIPQELRDQILFLTAGIVVLTILINGMTMEKLLSYLKLDRLPPAKEVTVNKAQGIVYEQMRHFIPDLKKKESLQSAKWDKIQKKNHIKPQVLSGEHLEVNMDELSIAFRRRLLESERKYYWESYKKGTLGALATENLAMVVEEALDEAPTIHPRPLLQKFWHLPKYYQTLENYPVIGPFMLKYSFTRIALAYEMARGFLEAQEEMLSHVDELAPSKKESKAVKEQILQNKQMTYSLITHLSSVFPEVICAIQTRVANRLILNHERSIINELLESGVLDIPEAKKMIKDVEDRMFSLLKMPTKIKIPKIKSTIKQLSWTKDIEKTTMRSLKEACHHHLFAEDEVIYTQGSKYDYLVIVVNGSVEIINDNTKDVEDIKGAGATLGLSSFFMGRSQRTFKTSLPTDVLMIRVDRLKLLMQEDATLLKNLKQA